MPVCALGLCSLTRAVIEERYHTVGLAVSPASDFVSEKCSVFTFHKYNRNLCLESESQSNLLLIAFSLFFFFKESHTIQAG